MTTTYRPQPGVHVGRPPCAECGAAYRLHRDGACPTAYRPGTIEAAVRELEGAIARKDPAAVFAARGDIQRLMGRGHHWDGCAGCRALDPDRRSA